MERILVRSPNWIGDQVMAYPFFHYLRAAYPKARITAACVPWVASIQFRNLVDDVIVLEKPQGPGFVNRFKSANEAAKTLRARGPWDLAISLPNSFSSAWSIYRAGARKRRGYATDGRSLLLTDRLPADRLASIHRAQAYVDLLPTQAQPKRPATEFWGVSPERAEPLPAALTEGVASASEIEARALEALRRDEEAELGYVEPVVARFDAARAWPGAEPVDPPSGNYFVLAPGSAAESRRWPFERFADIAQRMITQTGWTGVVVGGPAEVQLAQALCDRVGDKLVDLTAMGGVSAYWRVFEQTRLTLSNDSGLAHVASLCGSTVQVVWGAGDPKQTEPIGPGKSQLVFNPVDCWPCVRNTCSQAPSLKLSCLRGVETETVWTEIRKEIERESRPERS